MNLTDIHNLGIKKILDRGTGTILEQDENGIFVYDSISKAYMLSTDSTEIGREWLIKHEKAEYKTLVVNGEELREFVVSRYDLPGVVDCHTLAYLRKEYPKVTDEVTLRLATLNDLPFITANYDLVGEDEIKHDIELGHLFMGETEEGIVGFIGEHLEGSIGMLFVLPEFRRRGFGEELEKQMIIRTMKEGYIPFGQVIVGNDKSFALQHKLGLEDDGVLTYWLY